MNHHHAPVASVADLLSRRKENPERSEIVDMMSRCLVVAVVVAQLDLGDDVDVIETIRSALPQFRCRVILDHMDDALLSAKQALIAAAMMEG
jgi:hypothetical protein